MEFSYTKAFSCSQRRSGWGESGASCERETEREWYERSGWLIVCGMRDERRRLRTRSLAMIIFMLEPISASLIIAMATTMATGFGGDCSHLAPALALRAASVYVIRPTLGFGERRVSAPCALRRIEKTARKQHESVAQ